MRRIAVGSALALGLISTSFAAGRATNTFQKLHSIVATLPGDEADFGCELYARIRDACSGEPMRQAFLRK